MTQTNAQTGTASRTVSVDLEVTEAYALVVDLDRLADEISADHPDLAAQLRSSDPAAAAALLHRLRLDDPQHQALQRLWASMESNGEVSREEWAFRA